MSPEVKEKLRVLRADLYERWLNGEILSSEDYARLVALTPLPRQGTDFTTRDFYTSYKKTTKGNIEYRVSELLYGRLTSGYIQKMIQDLILNNKEIKTCPNIGTFSIISFIPSTHAHKKAINFPESKKRGFRVYYMNEHTGGKVYKFRWKCNPQIPFFRYYKFDPFKPIRKQLYENIVQNNAEYF